MQKLVLAKTGFKGERALEKTRSFLGRPKNAALLSPILFITSRLLKSAPKVFLGPLPLKLFLPLTLGEILQKKSRPVPMHFLQGLFFGGPTCRGGLLERPSEFHWIHAYDAPMNL